MDRIDQPSDEVAMNVKNLGSEVDPVFQPKEFGVSLFDKKRKEWQTSTQKKPLPAGYEQQKGPLDEDDRDIIQEIIEQIKPPYDSFYRYIKLKDMVECLQEVWDNDDD